MKQEKIGRLLSGFPDLGLADEKVGDGRHILHFQVLSHAVDGSCAWDMPSFKHSETPSKMQNGFTFWVKTITRSVVNCSICMTKSLLPFNPKDSLAESIDESGGSYENPHYRILGY